MAIEIVGSVSDGAINGLSVDLDLTALTGGIASSPAEGDVVIVGYSVGDGSTWAAGMGINSPTGYTQIANRVANDTCDSSIWAGYKIMGATPDTAVNCNGVGGTDASVTAAAVVLRNVDPAVLDSAAQTATRTNTARINPPAVTLVDPGAMVLVFGAAAHERGVLTNNTYPELTMLKTNVQNDNFDSDIYLAYALPGTSGVYDPPQWSMSVVDSTRYSNTSIVVAIRPGVVAGPSASYSPSGGVAYSGGLTVY